MSYWKTKVVPKFKKFFEKGKSKKGASEACKSFDSLKESLDKEIEEKTTDLHPKIIEIYRSTTIITKKLLKEPSEPAVKENPDAVQSVLEEMAKAGFPGAQGLSDAGGKFGPALLPGPIVYLFQKTSTFLVEEHLPEKEETREITVEGGEVSVEERTKEPEASNIEDTPPPPPVVATVEESSKEEKEVISIEAKEEEVVPIEAKKEEAACIEEAKKEEKAPVVEAKPVEVAPVEAKKEVTPIEEKKEEVCATKEDKKEVATPSSESKKEELKNVPTA